MNESALTLVFLWLRLGLAGTALAGMLLIRDAARARAGARALLAALALANGAFFTLFVARGAAFPLSQSYDAYVSHTLALAAVLVFALPRMPGRAAPALCLALITAYAAAGFIGLALEPVAKMQNQLPLAFLFVATRDVAVMLFALGAAVCVPPLIGAATPDNRTLAQTAHSLLLWGFVLFTLCQVFGSLWTITGGWGDVWLWKQSFIFSATTWIFYAGALHVRHVPRWPARLFPALAVAGFALQLFYLHFYYYAMHV